MILQTALMVPSSTFLSDPSIVCSHLPALLSPSSSSQKMPLASACEPCSQWNPHALYA